MIARRSSSARSALSATSRRGDFVVAPASGPPFPRPPFLASRRLRVLRASPSNCFGFRPAVQYHRAANGRGILGRANRAGISMKNLPVQFENQRIRRVYDEQAQTWVFSVVDIIQVLTQQPDHQASRKYWKVLKGRLAKEGSEVVTNCYQLKLPADDGKMRLTDVATGMDENKVAARTGGNIAKKARLELEEKTGQSVVTGQNFLPPPRNKKLEGPKR
jgi:hypothetical protein